MSSYWETHNVSDFIHVASVSVRPVASEAEEEGTLEGGGGGESLWWGSHDVSEFVHVAPVSEPSEALAVQDDPYWETHDVSDLVHVAPVTEGCRTNSDCPEGYVCVFSPGAEEGTCIKIGDIGVRIVGIIDGVTCAYCMTQIGRTGVLDSIPLPPFHKYCRCSLEYLEI